MFHIVKATIMSTLLATAPLPEGFTYLADIDPTIQEDVRYAMYDNIVGEPLPGYNQPRIILTFEAAQALKKVQADLEPFGLGLKVYDAYRPQRCVNAFVEWSKDFSDQRMKAAYYPEIDKSEILGNYVSARSTHSRGSTVDLTIVPRNSSLPTPWQPGDPLVSGKLPQAQRTADNSIDMGTAFDYFGEESHTAYPHLAPEIRANRLLLRQLMEKHGFRGISNEWWHFTLEDEPFPEDYFDFDVE